MLTAAHLNCWLFNFALEPTLSIDIDNVKLDFKSKKVQIKIYPMSLIFCLITRQSVPFVLRWL